jgi:hypothetical protein
MGNGEWRSHEAVHWECDGIRAGDESYVTVGNRERVSGDLFSLF